MLISYHQEDTPLHSRADRANRPMNEAPGGDHLRTTLLQVVTENKRFTKEKGRQKSADQPRDCSDPTYLEHPSIVAHECQYTKDKT